MARLCVLVLALALLSACDGGFDPSTVPVSTATPTRPAPTISSSPPTQTAALSATAAETAMPSLTPTSPKPTATATPTSLQPTTVSPTATEPPIPTESPTPLPHVEALSPPMRIDSRAGRLYLPATVDGVQKIVALSAADGQLLTVYDVMGGFAVDGNRLYVDRDNLGLTVLGALTGERQTTVPLPPNSQEWRQENPAPLTDPEAGRVLAFRDNIVYIVDAAQGQVIETIPFDVPRADDCRIPTDAPLPIEGVAYDAAQRILYLDFLTYVCTPWFQETLISFDLDARVEIGRGIYSYPEITAADGRLYGSSWYRLGVGYRWLWHNGQPNFVSAGWTGSADLFVDSTRGRVYEASADGGLRVFDAETLALSTSLPNPVEGDLAGYDPETDQLYFLSDGDLGIWPASEIRPPIPEPMEILDPPDEPVRRLHVSPDWSRDGSLFGLWDYGQTEGDCYVFGVQGGSLFVSQDDGDSWARPRAGLKGGCERISALGLSPAYASDRTLLAGIVGKGVFKSTDGGRLWLPSGDGLSDVNVSDILVSPGFERDQIAFARSGSNFGGQGTLYRSTDGGETWQPLGVNFQSVAMSPEFGKDGVLMGASARGMFLSADGGDSWERVGQVIDEDAFGMLSLAPLFERWQVAFVFGNTSRRLYRSSDGGQSWQVVFSAGESTAHPFEPQLVYGPETERGRLLVLLIPLADAGHLYVSEDGGLTWQAAKLAADILPATIAISPGFARDETLFVGTVDGRVISLDAAAIRR